MCVVYACISVYVTSVGAVPREGILELPELLFTVAKSFVSV